MINNNKGSMPLWISALGALALMGIITGTQQIMQGFVASKADHHLKVKYDSATKWAINLSAYLITNNLILCRKTDWDTTNNNKCKWNLSAPLPYNTPADFQLSNETFSGGKLSYDLSTPDEVDFNLTEDIKVVFDLVDWDASGELKKVIGDIPGGVCRNNTTKAVEKTCTASSSITACIADTDCTTDPNLNKCVSGFCSCCDASIQNFEAISNVDQDYDVVLVEIIAGENTANQVKDYVGIRRPLSRLILSFEESPKCALKCDVGSVASSSASCRSSLKTDPATVKVKVFNQGPGALYDLSLLREARERSKLKDPPPCTPPCGTYQTCENDVCVGRKIIPLTSNIQTTCTSDADCTAPQTCDIRNGICVQTCTGNTDCTALSVPCHTGSGICASACTSDADCTLQTCDTNRGICLAFNIGVILPGGSFTFEDTIICENSSGSGDPGTYFPKWKIREVMTKLIKINNDTSVLGDANVYEMSKNVNVYSEPFMELEYKLDLTTPETDVLPTAATAADRANIEPKRIFHHGNTIGLPDSISTAFMVYEPPN